MISAEHESTINPDEIYSAAVSGDDTAFTQLWESHTPRLITILIGKGFSRHIAEDICQTVWFKIARLMQSGKWKVPNDEEFRKYILRAVINQCNSNLKAELIHPPNKYFSDKTTPEPHVNPDSCRTPETFAEKREVSDTLLRALKKLPPSQRKAILLLLSDLSLVETAKIMMTTPDTIKQYNNRGRRNLYNDPTLRELAVEHGYPTPTGVKLEKPRRSRPKRSK